jgi:hypothetical protein
MEYSTTHEEKLSQKELDDMRMQNEQTLADYYRIRMQYWDFHTVKNVSQ